MAHIIGITGTLGAGKGTIVEYLIKKGYTHYSVRGYLTEELKKRSMPVNRDTMVELGNQLRKENSPSFIAEELYRQAEGKDAIIESIRTPGEIEALRAKGGFFLIAVDADQKIRYDRIYARKSETDRISFERFAADEAREMESDDPNKQNLKQCILMSDVLIENDGTIEELNLKVDEVLREFTEIL